MKPLNCLVVDDDILSREMISLYLQGIADCTMAEDGRQAVRAFAESHERGQPFDLIVMDIVMPDMDGNAAGAEIRRREKSMGIPLDEQVKIIVLSSLKTPKEVMQMFLASQSAAHLVKPVACRKLLDTLHKLELIELPGEAL